MVDLKLIRKDYLVRYWDTELQKIKFGVIKTMKTDSLGQFVLLFRISCPNPPYGVKCSQHIRVDRKNIKKNFGLVEYNDFIRENPQWVI